MDKMTVALAVAAALVIGTNVWAQDGKAAGSADKGKGGSRNPEAMFQKMDANNDGTVSKDEFVASHEARAKDSGREAPSKDMIEKRFAAMDTDNDGKLTKEEFVAGFAKMRGEHGKRGDGAAPAPKATEPVAK